MSNAKVIQVLRSGSWVTCDEGPFATVSEAEDEAAYMFSGSLMKWRVVDAPPACRTAAQVRADLANGKW